MSKRKRGQIPRPAAPDTGNQTPEQADGPDDELPPGVGAWSISHQPMLALVAFLLWLVYNIFSGLRACEMKPGDTSYCYRFGLYSTFALYIHVVYMAGLLAGHVWPRVQYHFIRWGLIMNLGLSLQVAVLVTFFGVRPSVLWETNTVLGAHNGDVLLLWGPVIFNVVYLAYNYRLVLLYLHESMHLEDIHAKRFTAIMHMSLPLLVFAVWRIFFMPPTPLSTDMPYWPGLGILLMTSIILPFPAWYLLTSSARFFYGPIMWKSFGRMGLVIVVDDVAREAQTIILY